MVVFFFFLFFDSCNVTFLRGYLLIYDDNDYSSTTYDSNQDRQKIYHPNLFFFHLPIFVFGCILVDLSLNRTEIRSFELFMIHHAHMNGFHPPVSFPPSSLISCFCTPTLLRNQTIGTYISYLLYSSCLYFFFHINQDTTFQIRVPV